MGYLWDTFFIELRFNGVLAPDGVTRVWLHDLATQSPSDLVRLYHEWLGKQGALK